ncbi:biotin transporter BioY [Agromyces laixinhei]|uniref:biotin transporter BioY n=1 Tax=Agromyces laixinhei TaxID=2585717 RepID=UPI0011161566|nr:biotin transporter BioY [Agromyces laixinhei]
MTVLAPPAPRRLVLADRVLPRSVATDVVLVVAGAALVGLFAQLYVPLWPVPVTGQTLAVLLVGSALGAVRGGLALAAYAALGVAGIPWFSEASSGWGVLAGPTGGYIIGFIVAAALTGWLAGRTWDRTVWKALACFGAGTLSTFAIGLPWLAVFLGSVGAPNDLASVLAAGFTPFLIGGVVKTAIAAVLLPLAWKAADRLPPRASR